MYFIRFEEKNFVPMYPDDLNRIREYLEDSGELKATDREIDEYYRDFSDSLYSASWLVVNENILEQFSCWLEEKCRNNTKNWIG